jgi:hypothetical protein
MKTKSSNSPRSVADIVADFGGPTVLARKLSATFSRHISPQGVFNWGLRSGIPGSWHLRLLSLAKREKVSLSADDLLRCIK